MSFWSLQGESWREAGRALDEVWQQRTKVGFWVTAAAVAAVLGAAVPVSIWWVGRNAIVITSLHDGDEVPRCIHALDGRGKLADGHHLWIAVEFSDPKGGHRVLFSREADMHDGKWHAGPMNVGGTGQGMSSYTITAVDADQATDKMLNSTLVDMSFSNAPTLEEREDLWRISYRGYPSGAHPQADVTVTRVVDKQRTCQEEKEQGSPK